MNNTSSTAQHYKNVISIYYFIPRLMTMENLDILNVVMDEQEMRTRDMSTQINV